MKAMILSAGRGERMRPLTDELPKPLLEVQDKPLIVWHLEKLSALGFKEVVINLAHLGYKISDTLGDGSAWNMKITYSDESDEGALESAGGIVKALALLGDEPFLLVNGDVFSEYDFDVDFDLKTSLAYLILVPNPKHNLDGDFGLEDGLVLNDNEVKFTYSGIGYYSPKFFDEVSYGKSALAPLLRKAIKEGKITGELFKGDWHDIGTPQRLKEINNR